MQRGGANEPNRQKQVPGRPRPTQPVPMNAIPQLQPNSDDLESNIMKTFCDRNCRISEERTHEEFFTAEELRKLRQKRPKIQIMYKVGKVNLSKYQQALHDLSVINSIIDIL